MADREKVVEGLECCIRKMEGQRVCDDCPYDEDFNCLGCSVVLRQALALLREQEPLRPRARGRVERVWACGECGAEISKGDAYCRMCGREADWDG